MTKEELIDRYFDWLIDEVGADKRLFNKVLEQMFHISFYVDYKHFPNDVNRLKDGQNLKYRFFTNDMGIPREKVDLYFENMECSVLEIMVALAIRCEETIMDDTKYGDRTAQWFWDMMKSLGLAYMTDDKYDPNKVEKIISGFMDHDYAPNGKGSLFTIRRCKDDLRDVDIWTQLCWYLDSIS